MLYKGDRVELINPDASDIDLGLKVGIAGTVLEDSQVPYVRWDTWTYPRTNDGSYPIIEDQCKLLNR